MLHAYPHNMLSVRRGWIRYRIVIAIIILVLLFLFANQGFRKMMRNRSELKRLEKKIEQLKAENTILKKELSLSKHDLAYLERIARKELGLIQPGEIEYRFIEQDTAEGSRHGR
jgi:cell division protein FtsB